MNDAISDTGKKRGRGRPVIGAVGVHVKLPPAELEALDQWVAAQADSPSRPEAIRRLMNVGLAARAKG